MTACQERQERQERQEPRVLSPTAQQEGRRCSPPMGYSIEWSGYPKCAENETLGAPKSTKIDHLAGSWGHLEYFWGTCGNLGGIGCVLGATLG